MNEEDFTNIAVFLFGLATGMMIGALSWSLI